MKKLIMCQGLPGSGKSFWADGEVNQDWELNGPKLRKIGSVSKDRIRAKLEKTGWKWSHENEKDVIAERDRLIQNHFKNGFHVVISEDTNLGKKHEVRLREIAKENGAEFSIKSFLDVPIETCIERDSKREGTKRVGEGVIRGMATQYNLGNHPDFEPYKPNPSLKAAIMCDLDGTLALFDGLRSPYDAAKCEEDRINEPIVELIKTYAALGYQIIYCSGREDKFREQTLGFLVKHLCPPCPPSPLLMRKSGDKRKDWIVKYELFNNHIRNNFNVNFVLDDRNQVVEMWRKIGLVCLQVADGNF